MTKETSLLLKLAATMLVICAVSFWAIYVQYYRYVPVNAAAEDECAFYHGAYKLFDVVGKDAGGLHFVECRYR